MKFSVYVLAALGAASTSSAFVAKVFSQSGCTGEEYEVNVWDNTCANNFPFTGMSIMPVVYGSKHQRARIHTRNDCSFFFQNEDGQAVYNVGFGPVYADVADGEWEVGHCIDRTTAALGSFRV